MLTPDKLVEREIFCNVSTLINELAKQDKYLDDLIPILVRDDFEAAAEDASPTLTPQWNRKKESAQEYCGFHNIDPYTVEAYEHWIVSGWLADKLEAEGEMVLRDFLGLTIWGRSCTGQMISMDGVICKITSDLNKKAA
jgi:hypothetical protein